jgi:hypothetical protein
VKRETPSRLPLAKLKPRTQPFILNSTHDVSVPLMPHKNKKRYLFEKIADEIFNPSTKIEVFEKKKRSRHCCHSKESKIAIFASSKDAKHDRL